MVGEVQIGDLPVATANPKVAVLGPDRTDARAIEGLGEIAGDIAVEGQKARTRKVSRDVGAGLNASAELIGEIEAAEREGREIDASRISQIQGKISNDKARKAFEQISGGLQQSGDRRTSAVLKARLLAEQEIRNVISYTPGFGSEIRQTARDVLGFDPTGETLKQLFAMQDAKVEAAPTEFDKLKEALGPSYDTPLGEASYNYMRQYNATAQETLKAFRDSGWFEAASAKATVKFNWEAGDISKQKYMSDWLAADKSVTKGASVLKAFQNAVKVEGEGLTDMGQAEANLFLNNYAVTLMEEFKADLPEGFSLTPEDISQAEAEINRQLEPTRALIKDADAFNILKEKIDTFGLLADRGLWENARDLMTLDRLSPEISSKVFDLLRLSTDPKEMELRKERYPIIKNLIDQEGIDNITKYVAGAVTAAATGEPNPNPAPNPEAQKAFDRDAANLVIDQGGLQTAGTAERLVNRNPQITLGKVAKNPDLLVGMHESALPSFKKQYLSQMVQLVPGLVEDLPTGITGGSTSPWLDGTLSFDKDLNGSLVVKDYNGNIIESKSLNRINQTFGAIYNSKAKDRMFDTGAGFSDLARVTIQLAANADQFQKINDQLIETSKELEGEMEDKRRQSELKAFTSPTLDAESLKAGLSTADSGVAARYKDLKDQQELIRERHRMLKQQASQFRGIESAVREQFPDL